MIKSIKSSNNWLDVKDSALRTIDKSTSKEPNSNWKIKILISEHSPIRKLKINIVLEIKSWISVHFVRHKIGIEHWVSTRRTDRTGVDRNNLRQDEIVVHEMEVDAQAVINISRRRLCYQASKETREVWENVIGELKNVELELASICVKECVYRNGLCSEFYSCGYNKTKEFKAELETYVNIINNSRE